MRLAGPAWAAVVLALHLGLATVLLKLPAWRDRAAPAREPAPIMLWQILAPSPPAPAPPERETAARRAPAAPRAIAAPATAAAEPQAITVQAAPAEPAASAAPGRAPLNLALPRGASAPWRQAPNPALEDPRFNPPPATLESRLGAVMGGDWRVERLDHDRVRMRRGSECYLATRSRAGQLELANGAFREMWTTTTC